MSVLVHADLDEGGTIRKLSDEEIFRWCSCCPRPARRLLHAYSAASVSSSTGSK